MKNRVRLVIAYLGTPFLGWQVQRTGATVQGTIEEACGRVLNSDDVKVVGSGRTDAGVHAAGQVAHIDLPVPIPPARLALALNNALPDTIRVLKACSAPDTFHARRSARAKRYVYRLRWNDCPPPPPWHVLRSAAVPRPRDPESLAPLIADLAGFRDWASFTVTRPETPTTTRTLFHARWTPRRSGADIEFVGDGFLRYQVRRLVGALLQVGQGRQDIGWFLDLLARPSPGAEIYTAPARGLTLEHVSYRTPHPGGDGRLAALGNDDA